MSDPTSNVNDREENDTSSSSRRKSSVGKEI